MALACNPILVHFVILPVWCGRIQIRINQLPEAVFPHMKSSVSKCAIVRYLPVTTTTKLCFLVTLGRRVKYKVGDTVIIGALF